MRRLRRRAQARPYTLPVLHGQGRGAKSEAQAKASREGLMPTVRHATGSRRAAAVFRVSRQGPKENRGYTRGARIKRALRRLRQGASTSRRRKVSNLLSQEARIGSRTQAENH